MYQVPLEELLLSSLLSIKRVGSNRLTNLPKESFSLSEELTRGAPSRCDRIKLPSPPLGGFGRSFIRPQPTGCT